MRLLEKERKALDAALKDVDGRAFLFGSRVDNDRKGGDIDLLVYSGTPSPYRLAQDITVRFQMECDEKIDVLVVDPEQVSAELQPFLNLISREAVPLK